MLLFYDVRCVCVDRSYHDENRIGKALSFAKPGSPFDILVQI
jgi:hypothetical protein